MNSMKQNELTTIELINQVAFRHFLEKGYEATNLRRI
ncbi:MAG: TetR/AcrR family transcriptional regulator, partial [Clostridiales bacterium]|nr:TetR/AcrR family transcriptional regulator [Clostridiales bacterium]